MMRMVAVTSGEDTAWIRQVAGIETTEDAAEASVIVASAALAHKAFALARGATPVVLIGDPGDPVDPRAAHVIRRGLACEQVQELLRALCGAPAATAAGAPPGKAMVTTADEAREVRRAFSQSRRFAGAPNLEHAEVMVTDAAVELVRADRATCLFLDTTGATWRRAQVGGRDERPASRGLAGFALRTGQCVAVERAAQDARWVASVDDPTGDGTERLVAQPILGARGYVHAVLVAVRVGRRLPFTSAELACLGRFSELVAPFFDQLSVHVAESALIQDDMLSGSLFRSEAMAAHELPHRGQVIRLAPSWITWAYWVLAALVVASALFLTIGTVATYSTGPATIRATSKRDLTARTSGNVVTLAIHPGEAVEAGAIVARLDDQPQRAALERAERELAAQLRNHMMDPADQASDQSVRQLRQVRDAARTALEERVLRSASRGIVTDVRVRGGQRVEPGEIVASMVDGDGPLEVIALLPGSDRPQLRPGMAMRLEIAGYRYAYQSLVIDSVSSDVIGPSAARRVLGAEVGESLHVTGPVVLVRGRLLGSTFTVDGEAYRFHDGMQGTATVGVRLERIVFALIPGIRSL